MKYLMVEYRLGNEKSESVDRTVLLEGDHRQSLGRMLEQFAREKLEGSVQRGDVDGEYLTEDGSKTLLIVSHRLLSEEEASQARQDRMTIVVNEHVTQPACRVRYSGKPRV